jgi:hypothetical protein
MICLRVHRVHRVLVLPWALPVPWRLDLVDQAFLEEEVLAAILKETALLAVIMVAAQAAPILFRPAGL